MKKVSKISKRRMQKMRSQYYRTSAIIIVCALAIASLGSWVLITINDLGK